MFHQIFTIPLLILLLFVNKPKLKELFQILVLTVIAVSYTIPWDSFLIEKTVWTYSRANVVGTVGNIPFEELFFMVVQVFISSLVFRFLLTKFPQSDKNKPNKNKLSDSKWLKVLAVVLFSFLSLVGFICLRESNTFYLGIILAWACPILAFQWLFMPENLFVKLKKFFLAITISTVYLCIADGIAIGNKIWLISTEFSTGLKIGGLPIEELIFFLLTNLLIIQGYSLITKLQMPLKD
ncbi:MAG: lycopene cyclase domain-containing protein [Candidatus Caenarcaniphilales bacterium]|nr:lycopene cyclase domain-containing protein [Candidatus Caenarcaniphilales bacterium]